MKALGRITTAVRLLTWTAALLWFVYVGYDFTVWFKKVESAPQQAALAATQAFLAIIAYVIARAVDALMRAPEPPK